ncbi:hypothetical protein V6767_20295 [Martelella sp. FLE1502]
MSLIQDIKRDRENGTPGEFDLQEGFSDWGMPKSHVIVPAGETGNDFDTWLAEIHSVTPYCAGAARKDVRRASSQLANAKRFRRVPAMETAILEMHEALSALVRAQENGVYEPHPAWDDARAVLAKIEGTGDAS